MTTHVEGVQLACAWLALNLEGEPNDDVSGLVADELEPGDRIQAFMWLAALLLVEMAKAEGGSESDAAARLVGEVRQAPFENPARLETLTAALTIAGQMPDRDVTSNADIASQVGDDFTTVMEAAVSAAKVAARGAARARGEGPVDTLRWLAVDVERTGL